MEEGSTKARLVMRTLLLMIPGPERLLAHNHQPRAREGKWRLLVLAADACAGIGSDQAAMER